ncbi:aspartate-alanine antiporter [Flavobacterium branchiicola]|uniref:Aspartate-alanine antiporter n=1 Tax=Flavobacterium branchiicola TaxID=1114875 RepID=A0ABV9PDM2_9FLAO|nr:aspartate-alanine antiporter [Flavobacterium branchiicola]MBS7254107.1 aspartate-alanine antiporter [Flavobacterium branchiicola]
MVTTILREHPELAIFLALALGFLLGHIKIGTFKIGVVLGTLFAGVLIGQIGIEIDPIVKTIFFDFFLFSTGYKVGPQFFQGLKKNALPQLLLTVVISLSCLLVAYTLSTVLGYDVGTAAGLLAGAFSESTVIGTASEAISHLDLADAEKTRLINNIPVAYAVTYLIGATSFVFFLTAIAPKLLGIDLVKESAKLEESISGDVEYEPGTSNAYKRWIIRAYRITNEKWIGATISEFEKSKEGLRIIVQRIRHKKKLIEPKPNTIICQDDVMVIMAQHGIILDGMPIIGPEVLDEELLSFPLANMDITITNKNIAGKTVEELRNSSFFNGLLIDQIIREYHELPLEPSTILNKGDVVKISGKKSNIEAAAKEIGYLDRLSPETDIIFVGLGIVLGGLLGLLSLPVFGVSITLTTSGGALVMGLIFGWLHSRTPFFGSIPEPALWIFDNVGLATFIGLIGLAAGPSFISALRETGISIIFAGLAVAIIPHIIGLYFGRYILKMNPIILLGAQTGAGTSTIGLKAVQDASGSKFPVLGYTIPYALGNILLTAWGPILVGIMS